MNLMNVIKNKKAAYENALINRVVVAAEVAAERAVERYDLANVADEAVERAVERYNLEAAIESAVDDYDFSSVAESAVEDRIEKALSVIDERVASAVNDELDARNGELVDVESEFESSDFGRVFSERLESYILDGAIDDALIKALTADEKSALKNAVADVVDRLLKEKIAAALVSLMK